MTFDPFKEFVKHAAGCEIMAKGSRGAEKTEWLELARRWQRCAENLDRELDVAAHHADGKDNHRHDLPGWARPASFRKAWNPPHQHKPRP